ncbi:MAG: hypothetical protein FWE59_01580 [Oscillospiraceae bacterium]|nr:hypothetical protein [Oscillospiraceae bacterium]
MSERKRRWGDRKDGRKLRSLDPINRITAYIMDTRTGASNYFHGRLDIRACEPYIRQKRVEGLKGFGLLHFFIAAYVRIVSQRPGVNRFISGQKLFARNNIEVLFAVKKDMSLEGQETVVKVVCHPSDTAADIFRRVSEVVAEARGAGDTNDVDSAAGALGKIPGFILKFVVWFLKKLDYIGKLPRSLTALSPFHGSIFVTDLGSINLPPVHHHLYEFGNIPIFLAFGPKQREYILDRHGQPELRRFLDFTLTIDERITDGFYFSGIWRMLNEIFLHPDQLDAPPAKIVEDVD